MFSKTIKIQTYHKVNYWIYRICDYFSTIFAVKILYLKESNPIINFLFTNFTFPIYTFIIFLLSYYPYYVGLKIKKNFYWYFLLFFNYIVVCWNICIIIIYIMSQ